MAYDKNGKGFSVVVMEGVGWVKGEIEFMAAVWKFLPSSCKSHRFKMFHF
jgi:hypothetical protein